MLMILLYTPHWMFFCNYTSKNLNLKLTKDADWLKLNKLSINIKNPNLWYFIFLKNKSINLIIIEIEYIKIDSADEFNFSGLTIHLKRDSHINKMGSKILNIVGMYRLKHLVPTEILLTIYNGLNRPHIIYGLKCWGFNQERILKLQKKAMRIICSSGYLSHSEPL